MPFEPKPNSGQLFANKDKTDDHPEWSDLQGKVNVDGKLYYVDAWKNVSDSGTKYLGLKLKPVQPPTSAPASGGASSDDDLF